MINDEEKAAKYAAVQMPERLAFKIKIEAISESKVEAAILECVLKSEEPLSDNIFNTLETISDSDKDNIIRAVVIDLFKVMSREAMPEVVDPADVKAVALLNIKRVPALQTALSLRLNEFYHIIQDPDKNKENLKLLFELYLNIICTMKAELFNNNLELEEDRIVYNPVH